MRSFQGAGAKRPRNNCTGFADAAPVTGSNGSAKMPSSDGPVSVRFGAAPGRLLKNNSRPSRLQTGSVPPSTTCRRSPRSWKRLHVDLRPLAKRHEGDPAAVRRQGRPPASRGHTGNQFRSSFTAHRQCADLGVAGGRVFHVHEGAAVGRPAARIQGVLARDQGLGGRAPVRRLPEEMLDAPSPDEYVSREPSAVQSALSSCPRSDGRTPRSS